MISWLFILALRRHRSQRHRPLPPIFSLRSLIELGLCIWVVYELMHKTL